MKITRTSPITGVETTMDLDINPAQYQLWKNGELIQRAMPNLTAAGREFILTGILESEWEAKFKHMSVIGVREKNRAH